MHELFGVRFQQRADGFHRVAGRAHKRNKLAGARSTGERMTGASANAIPCSWRMDANRLDVLGAPVLASITMSPGSAPSRTPPGPVIACSTSSAPGRHNTNALHREPIPALQDVAGHASAHAADANEADIGGLFRFSCGHSSL
jgi:hypothetical protein